MQLEDERRHADQYKEQVEKVRIASLCAVISCTHYWDFCFEFHYYNLELHNGS
jgi:hypothetical protein